MEAPCEAQLWTYIGPPDGEGVGWAGQDIHAVGEANLLNCEVGLAGVHRNSTGIRGSHFSSRGRPCNHSPRCIWNWEREWPACRLPALRSPGAP